jgi:hypothetical protein
MTPERFLYFILLIVAVIVVIFLALWFIDRLDDETANMIPTFTRAALATANRRSYE